MGLDAFNKVLILILNIRGNKAQYITFPQDFMTKVYRNLYVFMLFFAIIISFSSRHLVHMFILKQVMVRNIFTRFSLFPFELVSMEHTKY